MLAVKLAKTMLQLEAPSGKDVTEEARNYDQLTSGHVRKDTHLARNFSLSDVTLMCTSAMW